jgi:P27 family predicted phage terminase small subunit
MPGRNPTPAALIDAGKHKKSKADIEKRARVEEQIRGTTSLLWCPTHLTPEAKREWRRVMKLYKSLDVNILSDLDQTALIMYVEARAIYMKAHETWSKYQTVVAGNPEAQRYLDKAITTMERQTKIINTLADQLCLTPVGRAKMGMMQLDTGKSSALAELMAEED